MSAVPQRRHDAGRTLAQVVLALADGATCLSDLAALRSQPDMFGAVGAEATVWRTFNHIGPVELRGIAQGDQARGTAWAAGAGPASDGLVIDMDATIIRPRPTSGRRADLQAHLRAPPAAGDVRRDRRSPRRIDASRQCRSQPRRRSRDRVGRRHRSAPGTVASRALGGRRRRTVQHRILFRADSAGASHWLAEECVERNCEFSLGYQVDERVHDGVIAVPTGCWHPAVDADGSRRDGAGDRAHRLREPRRVA